MECAATTSRTSRCKSTHFDNFSNRFIFVYLLLHLIYCEFNTSPVEAMQKIPLIIFECVCVCARARTKSTQCRTATRSQIAHLQTITKCKRSTKHNILNHGCRWQIDYLLSKCTISNRSEVLGDGIP